MKATLFFCSLILLLVPFSTSAAAQEGGSTNPQSIKLQLVDSDIRDAFRLVAKQGGINMVLSNGVQGSISLELEDVSIQDALDAIASVGGYQYTQKGTIVTVTTLEELLEREKLKQEYAGPPSSAHEVMLFELRYVDADRVVSLVEKMLSETGTVSVLKTSDQLADDYRNRLRGGSNGNYQGQNSQGSSEDELQIGTQLSSSTRGQPAKSHTLVAVDTPERIKHIAKVIESIDVKPPQILIEARFVEVSLDDENRLGIDWNMVASVSGGAGPTTFPFGNSSLGSFNPQVDGGSPGGLFPAAPNSITSPTDAGLFTFGTLDFSALTAVLELIQTDSRVKIVSNPRIVVGDRHTATILVGERYPILSANISEFGTVTEQLDRYEPIGVQLEVTPAVLGDDEIELLVRPSTSSLGGTVSGSTGLEVARINSRQIDTSVTAQDSQTIVLGGLFTTREVEESTRVPYLSAVPLLGNLFEHESTVMERVDLVIFLTVTIVKEDGLTNSQQTMFNESSPKEDETAESSQLEFSSTGPLH